MICLDTVSSSEFPKGPMFEEDVEAATKMAIKILGPQGRMLYPLNKFIKADVKIVTPDNHCIWYGDINWMEDSGKLVDLVRQTQLVLSIYNVSGGIAYTEWHNSTF